MMQGPPSNDMMFINNQQMQQQMMMPDDMIGAIKIKDGLFIGDEFAAKVYNLLNILGLGIRGGEQSYQSNQLLREDHS